MNNVKKIIYLWTALICVGCSTVSNKPQAEIKPEPAVDNEPVAKYSTDPNYAPVTDREYSRMTKQKMEDESGLQAGAGSLWVMEGQTSYLFAQNKQRRQGDPTRIKMEGAALKQLELKVTIIQDLLNELEKQKQQAENEQKRKELDQLKAEKEKTRLAEIDKEKEKIISENKAGENPKDDDIQKMAEENVKKRMPAEINTDLNKKEELTVAKKEEKPDLKEVDLIPSKIIEKTAEGMYRISGQQLLTIKKRPYKVIATGLVRPEDFDDLGINSSKLLDPQFDVIHIKKTEKF